MFLTSDWKCSSHSSPTGVSSAPPRAVYSCAALAQAPIQQQKRKAVLPVGVVSHSFRRLMDVTIGALIKSIEVPSTNNKAVFLPLSPYSALDPAHLQTKHRLDS